MTGSASCTAVVFAYSEVGVRGLSALLASGVDVLLVVTHRDDPRERHWYSSVAELAALNDIPVIMPEDPNTAALVDRVCALAPHWIFSFYYRRLLDPALLECAVRGAYNLHGSMLPRYRGRAPVNWAIMHGEQTTGVSLHVMTRRADAGDVVDQEPVSILPNDTALDVSRKVAWAAERVVLRTMPALRGGNARGLPQDPAQASYFGARTPADGRIDWSQSAQRIHDLIRAVAPPFPGAFTDTGAGRLMLLGSHYRGLPALGPGPRLYFESDVCWADCRDHRRIRLLELTLDGGCPLSSEAFAKAFGAELVPE